MSKTSRSWTSGLLFRQELVVLSGAILFLIGLLFVSPVLRIVAFLLSGSLFAYVIVSRWRPRPKEQSVGDGYKHSVTLQEQEAEMKKLVFDDFQPTDRKYRVESVEDHANKSRAMTAKRSQIAAVAEYEFQPSDFFDVNEDVFVREGGPKSEFGFLMKKVLTVIKEVNFAHSVAFFWVNKDKNQAVLESFVSDSDKFMTHRRRELGSDVISRWPSVGNPGS
jgi:hypothetical protein